MKPVAADAPTGSHQVLATKKYVLTRVISQIKTSNARPIPQPPIWKTKGFPQGCAASHNASTSRRRVYHNATHEKQARCERGARAAHVTCRAQQSCRISCEGFESKLPLP